MSITTPPSSGHTMQGRASMTSFDPYSKSHRELIDMTILEISTDAESVLYRESLEKLARKRAQREQSLAEQEQANAEKGRINDEVSDEINRLKDYTHTNANVLDDLASVGNLCREMDNILPAPPLESFDEGLTVIDNLKMNLAQELTELEAKVNRSRLKRLQSRKELEEVKSNLDATEDINLVGGDSVADSNFVILNLFRNMGLRVESIDGKDQFLVYNNESKTSKVFTVHDHFSDYFVSKEIWNMIQGFD
ncbi:probable kinetochore protein Spc24p [Diutina catenulata]